MTLSTLYACLLTAGLTLWLTRNDTPPASNIFIPERLADQSDGLPWMMGGWITEEGYQPPGRSAVEIRCCPEQQLCTEAVATIFQHTKGSDPEAQTYLYQVTDWMDAHIQLVAIGAVGECLDRRLQLYPADTEARLDWGPSEGCEGDNGSAVLICEVWVD